MGGGGGGGEFNYSGKQGNMNHPPSLFLKALTFEALRYRSGLAESTHLMWTTESWFSK